MMTDPTLDALKKCQRVLAMLIEGKANGVSVMAAYANVREAELAARKAIALAEGRIT